MDTLLPFLERYVIPIVGAFVVAWIIHRISNRLVNHFVNLTGFAPERMRPSMERQHTLRDLLSSMISFLAFAIAFFITLSRFVSVDTLIWMVGLMSAGIGFGARPFISDWLTGILFIFEDTLDVGEKIETMEIEGVVEKINLRSTLVRAPTGELYIIPNGEIRVIRNFSRGRFSSASITIKVPASELKRTVTILHDLGEEAMIELPNLLEPWQVMNLSGSMGERAELTLAVKARFGKAAELRPHLLALVQERLAAADIPLWD